MAAEKVSIVSPAILQNTPVGPLVVMRWELRRLAADRSSWMMAGTAFALFLGILFIRHDWSLTDGLTIYGTTIYGQLNELVLDLIIIFGLFLPFIATDIVAHDYKQRMHELLMTTVMSTRVYIYGRYLASLIVSLGLAALMCIAQLGLNLTLWATGSIYPAPHLADSLALWSVIVLPATILICSMCFALGAFIPRATIVAKLAMCAVWVILAFDMDPRDLGWRVYWNPTSAGMDTLLTHQLRVDVGAAIQTISGAANQALTAMKMQQHMPDLSPWVGSYLVLAVLGMLLVVAAAAGFRRFRDVLG